MNKPTRTEIICVLNQYTAMFGPSNEMPIHKVTLVLSKRPSQAYICGPGSVLPTWHGALWRSSTCSG